MVLSPSRPAAVLVALLSGLVAAALPVRAAEPPVPVLFADLNPNFSDGHSDPSLVGRAGDLVLFHAGDEAYGQELWRTDGTARGTFLLADVCPGRCSSLIGPVVLGGPEALTFFEQRPEAGSGPVDLWRSDGTPEGTFRLRARGRNYVSAAWNAQMGRLVFDDGDFQGRHEVWATDGSREGTHLLVRFQTGNASSVFGMARLGAHVYFVADDGAHGRQLWRTDGTAAGTERLTGLPAGPVVQGIYGPVAGRLILLLDAGDGLEIFSWDPEVGLRDLGGFRSDQWPVRRVAGDRLRLLLLLEGPGGSELWSTDGTPRRTGKLLDVAAPPLGPDPFYNAVDVGEGTVFGLYSPASGGEPWVTDGTAAGTRLVADVCPGPCFSVEGPIGRNGSHLVVPADDGVHGTEPWITDGTAAGTFLLGDLCPGACSGIVLGSGEGGFLAAATEDGGRALWRTDGTSAGTVEIERFEHAHLVQVVEGRALLSADDGLIGREPWWSDGTAAGTHPLGNLSLGMADGSHPEQLRASRTAAGDRLFFVATGADGRRTLWASDGTVAGSRPLAGSPDLAHVPSHKLRLEAGAGGAFLLVEDDDLGPEVTFSATLYWSDGVAPVRTLGRIGVGRVGLRHLPVHADGDRLFVLAEALWTSDGTAAGTVPLLAADLTEVQGSALVGGVLQFVAPSREGAEFEFSLWRSDGTPEGTLPWFRDDAWQFPLSVGEMEPDGSGGFWFVADQVDRTDLLWHSDGTPAGTGVAVELDSSLQPRDLVAVGDRLFFRGGEGWWVSDGTVAGTVQVGSHGLAPPGPDGTRSEVVFQDELVFLGSDRRLYRTDGSGQVLLGFPPTQSPDSLTAGLFVAADRLFLVARPETDPWQLWMLRDLDGTPLLLAEMPASQFGWSHPAELGGRVFLAGYSEEAGVEPLVLDFAAAEPPPADRCVPSAEHLCLLDGRYRVRVDWRDPRSGDSGTGGAAPFPGSERTGTFWFFDPANVELIVKMLDGESVNGFVWTFYGALSDVEYWIDVEDVETGWRRTYHNPPREICGRADTGTFEAEPAAAASSRQALAPAAARPVTATEVPDCAAPGVLCLDGDRFRLEVAWRDPRSGDTGRGTAIPGTSRSGYFWFFRDDNVELVAKVLDGRPVNGHHWVFWGALTDVEYDLRVVDAVELQERSYHNPPGNVCGGADTTAF